jgi:cytoskeleton protein RodZ
VGKSPQATAGQGQLSIFDGDPMTTENNDCATAEHTLEGDAAITATAIAAVGVASETLMDQDLVSLAANIENPQKTGVVEAPQPKSAVVISESLGLRLRAAREAKGLTCEAAAQKLRLPASILQSLETERFDRIGHAIYLRSYLTKYLQLLGLPTVLAERVLHEHAAPQPQLVTTGTVSRPRYLFERYSGSALYVILTGVIVVPAVLLAMRAGFDQNLVRVSALETTEVLAPLPKAQQESTPATQPEASPAAAQPATKPASATAPFIASMTPFPAPATSEAAAAKNEAAAVLGGHKLRLNLAEASWVEITASDGQKIEYGLLPAGSSRSYDATKALDVRIGNANGATLEVDGKPRDIAPYRHSNVAHFKLTDGETSTAVHSAG